MKNLILPTAFALFALPAFAQGQLANGYYVDVEHGCAGASNATLALLHAKGLNSARTDCTFNSFTEIGPNTYRYTETCMEIVAEETFESEGNIELLTEESFRLFGEGFSVTMAYCPQSALPEPWSSTDLSDVLGG